MEGGRETERNTPICCSTYLRIPWLMLVRALSEDQTDDLGLLG